MTKKKTHEAFELELLALAPNLKCVTEYKGAKPKVIVKNILCNHEWEITPTNAIHKKHGLICPICNVTSRKKSPLKFIEEMNFINPSLQAITEYSGTFNTMLITSTECGHEWEITPSNFISHEVGHTCPTCNPRPYGKAETNLYEFIEENYDGWIIRNDRKILEGRELDIVLPDLGLAFEYNGIRWHNEDSKSKDYHLNKTIDVHEFGYQLIHVMEDEWNSKKDIVKSRILSLLGKSTKVYARKCTVKEIAFTETSKFLETNHLRDAGAPSKINLGLFLENELIAIETFSTPKTACTQQFELVRYCSKLGTNVIGGASKLLKYFIKIYNPLGIISYSDNRWSIGNLYNKLGFTYSHSSTPGYRYYKGLRSLSRQQCQKHKLKDLYPEQYKDELTEAEIMKLVGFTRVYDCGNKVWILK